jgi:Leucine-rich repeat (LRR) protein
MELERLPKQLWTKVLGMPDNEITLPSTPPVGDDDDETVPSYEVEDLTQLKAASNMLKEIEPEIGFFASLRILDVSGLTLACAEALLTRPPSQLKDNRLRDLPASVANLLDLTLLDIS